MRRLGLGKDIPSHTRHSATCDVAELSLNVDSLYIFNYRGGGVKILHKMIYKFYPSLSSLMSYRADLLSIDTPDQGLTCLPHQLVRKRQQLTENGWFIFLFNISPPLKAGSAGGGLLVSVTTSRVTRCERATSMWYCLGFLAYLNYTSLSGERWISSSSFQHLAQHIQQSSLK